MAINRTEILSEISALDARLKELDQERDRITDALQRLRFTLSQPPEEPIAPPQIDRHTPPEEKIALFRSLFRGREDVYPKFWESKAGFKGYSPVCMNEWVKNVCKKPSVKCGECDHRVLVPLTNKVVQNHLEGKMTIGVYTLLSDETCYFLAADFDNLSWKEDAVAFLGICRQNGIPASLEISRSGNGGHVWIFFSEPVPAYLARNMGTFLITETMSQRHEIDMKSYDRLFPNQDTMPKGGFGSLIALPLQKAPVTQGKSVFVDEKLSPYCDQWAYLSSISRMSQNKVRAFVEDVSKDLMRIRACHMGEEDAPWEKGRQEDGTDKKFTCPLPEKIDAVIADKIYIAKAGLPSTLITHFTRLASFQNPEFYRKQSMRLSVRGISRVITCAEIIQDYLVIPRGCLEDLQEVCSANGISLVVKDLRTEGKGLEANFQGELTEEQEKARKKILQYDMGVLVAPPGRGKTVIGISLIVARRVNTLVLTHRKPLLEQWRAQIAEFLGMPKKDVGQIGGGKDKATGVIDVAMLQSLERKGQIDSRIKNYGQIIIDECHHITAFSFEGVLKEAKAKYITGLTATPYRRDGHQPIITMQCGPIRHKIILQKGAEAAVKNVLISRQTNFNCPWSDGDKIYDLWPQLIMDEDRNEMIVKDITAVLQEKRSPIILTERKEHLEALRQKLEKSVKHIILLHGGMKAKIRKEMLAKLVEIPDSEERLILATGQYIGEGFDDPRLDTLFLAMPFSFKGKMVQYAGRLHRSYPGKTVIRIYDYVDTNIPMLVRMYKRRLKAYKSIGYAGG